MFDPQMLIAPKTLQERYMGYQFMRQAMPVMNVPETNLFMLFNFEDVHRALYSYEEFSSAFERFMPQFNKDESPESLLSLQSIIGIDPPLHTKLRGLINRAFTPRRLEQFEPRIQQIVTELLDQIMAQGNQFDVIKDFGDLLPSIVIAEMLGVPSDLRADFKTYSDILIRADITAFASNADGQKADVMLVKYFREIIADHRANPKEDLTSALIAAEIDGEHLNEIDLIGFCQLLLVAGNVTTTHLIANAMLAMIENPDQAALLRANPDLMTQAIEEVIRYYSPSLTVLRTTTKDITINGQAIPSGSRVLPLLASANRDANKFSNPDQFDVMRTDNQHVGFGHGVHYCLGAPLARLEGRVALTQILQKMQNFALVPDTTLQVAPGVIVNAYMSLPITYALTNK